MKDRDGMVNQAAEKAYTLMHTKKICNSDSRGVI